MDFGILRALVRPRRGFHAKGFAFGMVLLTSSPPQPDDDRQALLPGRVCLFVLCVYFYYGTR